MARKRRSLLGRREGQSDPATDEVGTAAASDEGIQTPQEPVAVAPAPPSAPEGAAGPALETPETPGDWVAPGPEAWSAGSWEGRDGFSAEGSDAWTSSQPAADDAWGQAERWTPAPRRTLPTTPPPAATMADGDDSSPDVHANRARIQEWDDDGLDDAPTEPPPLAGTALDAAPPAIPPAPTARVAPTISLFTRPPILDQTPPPPPQAGPVRTPPALWVRPDFNDDDQEAVNADDDQRTAPWSPWKVAVAVGLGSLVSLGVVLAIFVPWMRIADEAIPAPPEGAGVAAAQEFPTGPRSPDAGGVEVRRGLRSPPRFDAVDPAVVQEVERMALRDPPDLRRPVTPTAAREVGEIGGVGQPPQTTPPPAPQTGATEAPEPTPPAPARRSGSVGEVGADPLPPPAPAPTFTRPKPAPADPATLGTLKIRANRRVLVYVDGKAIGYAPTDHLVAPGAHSVRAMLPGQPATAQTQSIDVAAAGSVVALDFAF